VIASFIEENHPIRTFSLMNRSRSECHWALIKIFSFLVNLQRKSESIERLSIRIFGAFNYINVMHFLARRD
jgi:hypothetical protein